MIDTHAHLSKQFIKQQSGSIEAMITGLEAVILAASSVGDSKENVRLAKKYFRLRASVGIHPQQTDPENKATIDEQTSILDNLILKNKQWIVAVGECGLDYSTPPPEEKERNKDDQERLFRKQIVLAGQHNLPLIIHARKAVDQVISILKDYPKAFGVFHCWAGGIKRIVKVVELGSSWYFGIDGNLTYEIGLEQVVKKIPKDKLVLETDSPFLTPAPHRGESNRPEYVKYVYKRLAKLWQMSFEETDKQVDKNADKLFGLSVFRQD